ncbi:DUF4097 family beta strand repeat-containing protein [Actinocorallia longicatena]|uniref:DUF4097 domain-containing protein n=1 Tax=Actinocorallia longicatena TaxID=111803 RepID=A0ABP6Q2V2_9ACTN
MKVMSACAAAGLMVALTGCGGDGRPGGDHWRAGDGGRTVVITENGVRLRGVSGDRITVDGRVAARWSPGSSTLDLRCPENGAACDPMPVVSVPAGTAVTVTARNAGIEASGLTGSLDLTTVNGDVVVAGPGDDGAPLRLATQNGSVRVASQRAASVEALTTNGDVVLGCATAPARVTATTVNGSVRLTLPPAAPPYAVTAATEHGRTSVTVPTSPSADRHLTLRTTNGDLTALSG